MIHLIDTNIIMTSLLNDDFEAYFKRNYFQGNNRLLLSAVTEGELKALVLKRKWGKRKVAQLRETLKKFLIHPIKVANLIDTYAQIDAYSQNKLDHNPLPKGMTARNMGKNDIWIAATAHVTGATLVTTDKDFDHLDEVYFRLDRIDLTSIKNKRDGKL